MANKELLTREEAQIVVDFAAGLADEGIGFWTPFLTNQYLQGLNNDAKIPSSISVRKALQDYKSNAENLQSYMEYARFFDMIFSRTVQSYINSLSFDLQVICTNAFTQSDYESSAYEEDRKIVNDFLNKFNYKKEFRDVVQQILLHEVYYVWFRKNKWGNKDKIKYALQTLPQDRCILTGYWEKGLLFDFDMSYFIMAGTDINGYDPAFKKYYNRVFGENSGLNNYRPTNPLDKRIGVYNMWTQTSPMDGAWAFKFDTSNFNTTPFLAPYLKNAITNDEIQQMQYNKDMAEAFAILAGEIATFDTAKSGTTADQMVFNPKTLGQFMAKAKAGLSSTVKLAALPVENLKWYQFQDSNKDMYEDQLKSSAAVGTGASRIIYSTDRMSNAEVEAALNEVYQTMKPLYYQFGNFMDFFVNQQTKKYKFKFLFDGSSYRWEREARFDKLSKLSDKGIVLASSAWASAIGLEPQLFEASLMESKYSGWQKNLSMLLNRNTLTQSSDSLGRPTTDFPDDSTDRNKDQ